LTSDAAAVRRLAGGLLTPVAVGVAMVVFAVFAHRGWPWIGMSGVGLLGSAALIGRSLRERPGPWWLSGSAPVGRRFVAFVIVAVVLGVIGGAFQRHYSGAVPAPAGGLHLFVAVACLIGGTEELVYRGWMLPRLSALGWPAAVVLTAIAHGAYKAALFAWPPSTEGVGFNLAGVALWTVLGGTVLGLLRVSSRSVLPAVLAHAAFDAVAYSAYAAPPWWVWG
jgi:membrane protease YdiL (CAAX protease family)